MNSTVSTLKISPKILSYLKQSDNCKILIIGFNSQTVYELVPNNDFSQIDYYFSGDESSKIEERNEIYDFIYVDVSQPEKISQILGGVIQTLKYGGILAGNQFELLPENKKNNPILSFANRFGFELELEEDGKNWHLIKKPVHISFIIPAFNCAKTIEETVCSIVDGNLDEGDEIVIVDDGSTDATWSLLEGLQKQYPLIKLVAHSKNKGGAYARNTAVDNAKAPLIFCLDSDNVLKKGSIKKLKDYLISQNADIAAFERLFFFKTVKSEITHEWIFKSGLVTFADSLSSEIIPISSGNYLYSRASWDIASGYPLFSRALDAWGFGVRQLGTGQKMVVLENTGYFHRYGHPSYWVREQSSGDTSKLAVQLIAPFINELEEESILYLFKPESRDCWFENLRKRPLKLMGQPIGFGGVALDPMGNDINLPQKELAPKKKNILKIIKSYIGS